MKFLSWTYPWIFAGFLGIKAYAYYVTLITRQLLLHKSSNKSGIMQWFKHQRVWLITTECTTRKHMIPKSKLDKNIYFYLNEAKPLATFAFCSRHLFRD